MSPSTTIATDFVAGRRLRPSHLKSTSKLAATPSSSVRDAESILAVRGTVGGSTKWQAVTRRRQAAKFSGELLWLLLQLRLLFDSLQPLQVLA